MDEPSASALQYGHLGKAVYSPETQSWTFSRALAQPSLISYTGATKTTVTSPITASQSSLVENKNLLLRVHPELAAGWSFIGNETFSHVITTTSETCDSQTSSLLDLGYAVEFGNDGSGNRVVPIAAFASGECGNSISFRRLEEDTLELKHQTTWMRVPSIGETEATGWLAGGAPVRQICFARTIDEKPTWMAARFPDSTTILRPIYHRDPVPIQIHREKGRVLSNGAYNSRLDPNPLVQISNSRTGGFAHADVTFNPWYQRQFAIVDQQGNWTIWDVSGRHRRNKGNWAATCVKSGSLPWFDIGDSLDLDDQPRHDGWVAIEWAGNVKTLIVSDRRCPMLYRLEGDQVWPVSIELGLKIKSEWILDMKRSPLNVSHFFILTTTRIFWLDVTPSPEGDTGPSLYPRLSWRHFRDPEDMTLQLSPLLINEDFYLFLYSRLNHFVLGFQCPNASKEIGNDVVSALDPFILDVPSIVDVPTESQISPSSAQFSTLVFKEISHSPTSVGKTFYDPRARLAKLFLLDSRLAVRESVYIAPAIDSGDPEEQTLGREALQVRRRQHGTRRSKTSHYWNDFIVDDWDESVSGMGTLTIADSGISTVTPRAIPQWTTDYTAVYAVATGKLSRRLGGEGAEHYSEGQFRETIKELEEKLTTLSDNPTSETLLELLGNSPLLDDIDQNARAIEEVISFCERQALDPKNEYQLSVLPSDLSISPLMDFATTQDSYGKPSLIGIYDRLVNDWLSNLPHDIPGRTRIMKEKVIGRLAADLILARINVTRETPNGPNETLANEQLKYYDDVESSNPESTISTHRVATPRRSSLPVSEKGRDGSIPRSDFAAENSQSFEDGRVPLYSSLLSLTTFNHQPSVPRSIEPVLSHWTPGTDPAAYDWQKTVQSITDDETQRTSSRARTPKHRPRKKTPQATSIMSSPAPPPVSPAPPLGSERGSQPTGGDPRHIQATTMEEDFPMTQVERGAFGGREAARRTAMKTRKKKRAAGF